MYFLSKTDLNVLKMIMKDILIKKTIRQIAKEAKQDYRIVYFSIKKLQNTGIIKIEKKANLRLCAPTLSENIPFFSQAVNSATQFYLEKNKEIKFLIYDIIRGAETSFFTMILFGSAAKNFKKAGDIDIAFIIPDKKFEKKITIGVNSAQRKFTKAIHELIFTESEFKQMLEERGKNVGKEIIKNSIILYGTEAYVKMMADIYG